MATHVVTAARSITIAVLAMTCGGCVNPDLFYFMQPNRNDVPAPVQLLHKRKETRKLLVITYTDSSLRFGFDSIDTELNALLIAEIAVNEKRLVLIPERQVRQWKDLNPDWMEHELQDIGENFDVDYVMFMEIQKFTLNQTQDQYLLQGAIEVKCRIHDTNKGTVIFTNTYNRDYPKNNYMELTALPSVDAFRAKMLQRVAKELSWYVVPHAMVDSIAHD